MAAVAAASVAQAASRWTGSGRVIVLATSWPDVVLGCVIAICIAAVVIVALLYEDGDE